MSLFRDLRIVGIELKSRTPVFTSTPQFNIWPTVKRVSGGTAVSLNKQITKVAEVALGVADTGGGVLSWQNPESLPILVTSVDVRTTTKSTGASTIDVGVSANDTTSDDTLIDGADTGTAAGLFSSAAKAVLDENGGTTDYITGSKASGACAGLVGYAYIQYVVLAATP